MLKTIKTKNKLRLDELIKYVWENMNDLFKSYGIITFYSKNGKEVAFNSDGMLQVKSLIDVLDYFEIQVEEVITEDTEFDCIISVDKDGYTFKTFNTTIDYLNSTYSDLVQNLAYINGKFITIWERDNQ